MARVDNLKNFLTDVANAIRSKTGKSETLSPANFDTEIESISGGGDISEYINEVMPNSISSSRGASWFSILKKLPPNLTFNGTSASYMFYGCKITEKLDFSKYPNLNFSNVTHANYMFNYSDFSEIDISALNTQKLTTLANMFSSANATKIIINNDFPSVSYAGAMFRECQNLVEIDFKKININSLTDISTMFYSCTNLQSVDLSWMDTQNVTNMMQMFYNCKALKNIDFSNFNTSKCSGYAQMFQGCTSLTSLDLQTLDFTLVPSSTSGSTTSGLNSLFSNCTSLKSVKFKTQTLTKTPPANQMFNSCREIEEIDLSPITGTFGNISQMFSGCVKLKKLDIRNLVFSTITTSSYYSNMFGGSTSSYVPADCLIIVKDNTEKAWFNSKFSRMTNVKTVDEYIAEGEE